MLKIRFGMALACVTVAMLAGCGGDGNGGGSGSTDGLNHFSIGAGLDYNGSTSTINTNDSSTVTVGNHTQVTVKDGRRTVLIDLPVSPVANGQTFKVGVPGGAAVTYSEEHGFDSPMVYEWTGTSGDIAVMASGGTQATLTINRVALSNTPSDSNPAAGSLLISGKAQATIVGAE